MSTRRPVPLLALGAAVLALCFGGVGCSGDDATASSADTSGAPSTSLDGDGGDAEEGGSTRPFDVDRDTLGTALATATRASSYEVDGETIRLRFDEGSKDAPAATINCQVSTELKAPTDRIELIYPDGSLECSED